MGTDQGWRRHLVDLAVPAAVGGVLVIHILIGDATAARPAPFDYLLVIVGAAGLVACRRAPRIALLVTTVAMAWLTVRLQLGAPAAFPVMAAVFMAARSGHYLLAPAASLGYLAAVDLMARAAGPPGESAGLLGWFVAANIGGAVYRRHRAYLEQVEQRAREAERTREEAALRRAGEERLRIARELHDTLTHSISIIKLQAGVAVHLARKRGEPVPEALLAIQEASGEAMRELRATLDVLRSEGDEAGIDRIAGLVKRSRDAGLDATLTVTGDPLTVPADVGRAAYRIVQEALTNITRHAGSATATVRLHHLEDHLVVRVDDDGPATTGPPVYGNGLTGMAERVAALGGRLHAGPRDRGGFTVRAELPAEVRVKEPS